MISAWSPLTGFDFSNSPMVRPPAQLVCISTVCLFFFFFFFFLAECCHVKCFFMFLLDFWVEVFVVTFKDWCFCMLIVFRSHSRKCIAAGRGNCPCQRMSSVLLAMAGVEKRWESGWLLDAVFVQSYLCPSFVCDFIAMAGVEKRWESGWLLDAVFVQSYLCPSFVCDFIAMAGVEKRWESGWLLDAVFVHSYLCPSFVCDFMFCNTFLIICISSLFHRFFFHQGAVKTCDACRGRGVQVKLFPFFFSHMASHLLDYICLAFSCCFIIIPHVCALKMNGAKTGSGKTRSSMCVWWQ